MARHDEIVDAAIGWLRSNQDMFGLDHAATPDQLLRLIKPVGELALAASVLRKLGRRPDWVAETLDYSWRQFDQGDLLLKVLVARPDLVVASTIYAGFVEAGFRNPRLDTWLRRLEASASCNGIEFPAWRRLDVAHGYAALGYRPFPADPERGIWLAGLPEPWMISEDIAYAVTHEVFYITDFGRAPDRLSRDVRAYVAQWLPAWAAIWERQANWDLFAEFAMVAACLKLDSGSLLSRLALTQDAAGFFPGPAGSAASLIGRRTPSARAVFLANYHTTLVALMAFVLAPDRAAA